MAETHDRPTDPEGRPTGLTAGPNSATLYVQRLIVTPREKRGSTMLKDRHADPENLLRPDRGAGTGKASPRRMFTAAHAPSKSAFLINISPLFNVMYTGMGYDIMAVYQHAQNRT